MFTKLYKYRVDDFSIRTDEFEDKHMSSYVKQQMSTPEEGELIIIMPLTGTVAMNHRIY